MSEREEKPVTSLQTTSGSTSQTTSGSTSAGSFNLALKIDSLEHRTDQLHVTLAQVKFILDQEIPELAAKRDLVSLSEAIETRLAHFLTKDEFVSFREQVAATRRDIGTLSGAVGTSGAIVQGTVKESGAQIEGTLNTKVVEVEGKLTTALATLEGRMGQASTERYSELRNEIEKVRSETRSAIFTAVFTALGGVAAIGGLIVAIVKFLLP